MINVKISTNFPEWPLERQLPSNECKWNNTKYFVNDDYIEQTDFWVIYEDIGNENYKTHATGSVILITGEPPSIKKYNTSFLNQFDFIVSCHHDIKHPGLMLYQQGLPWHLGRYEGIDSPYYCYDSLQSMSYIEKTKLMSIVVSNKNKTSGHRKRLEFVEKLKDRYGDNIDVFGRGIKNINDKTQALVDYKYHIVVENCSVNDYWTEKLADTYLALSYPIYYGCPNINDYFSNKSLTKIDINDINGSFNTIENVLNNDNHRIYFNEMSASRNLILNKYNIFSFISCIVNVQPKVRIKKRKINSQAYYNGTLYSKLFKSLINR